jgi:GNAT superfamily N-acetyltransferase
MGCDYQNAHGLFLLCDLQLSGGKSPLAGYPGILKLLLIKWIGLEAVAQVTMNDIECRCYREGDETSIVELFPECFPGRTITMSYWTWRFRDNPLGRILIELAWAGDRLIAHYAVTPVLVRFAGHDTLSGLSVTTMTHPEYRGRGLFPILAGSLYERMAHEGYGIVWGFPNENSHATFVNKLQWRDISRVPMLRLQIDDVRTMPTVAANIVTDGGFDERFKAFWEQGLWDRKILVKRDPCYLAWRYRHNPENRYSVIRHEYRTGLSGYVVWKAYAETELEVVDLLAVPDLAVGLDLVHAAINTAAALGMKVVKIWLPLHDPLRVPLERMGFRESDPWTHFGARSLGEWPGSRKCHDEANWHYALGDSDVF